DLLMRAIEAAGYRPGEDVFLGLDCAATEFFRDGAYDLAGEGRKLDAGGLVDHLAGLCDAYPIVSIEDGLAEDEWQGWAALTGRRGGRVQLVGDDLSVTNPARLAVGIARGAGNAVLVNVNQIGALAETLESVQLAQHRVYGVVMSHRSGQTE